MKPSLELGIQGIPDRLARMSPGMIYAIALDQQAVRITLIARTLLAALKVNVACALVSPLESTMLLKKAGLVGVHLSEYMRLGQLRIFRQRSDSQGDMSPISSKWLLNELRQYKLGKHSLVIFDHADERFCLNDPATAGTLAGTYQDWVEENDITLLATFAPRAKVPRDYVTLRAVAENFGGFALVKTTEEDAVLDVRHWFGPLGAVQRSSFVLSIDDQGLLQARTVAIGGRVSVDPAHEQEIVTRRAGEDFNAPGGHWRIADSLLDAIDHARQSPGGTVVLHFDRVSGLKDLAQTVAALRSSARPQLRIVVRECGARLRLPQMVALLRLGVSTVIPKEVSGASARLMAESLRGTLFTRTYETDVTRVLSEARSEAERGPLPIAEFRGKVEQLLAISGDLDVPGTLVRFSMVSPQILRTAKSALQRGARDSLFTEHDGCIWAFLFGCAPEHCDVVLARLMGARFERLMAGWQRIAGAKDILTALRLLDHAVIDPSDALFGDTIGKPDEDAVPVEIKSR